MVAGVCSIKMIPFQNESTELCMHKNCTCKCTDGVARQLSWLHETSPCVLIILVDVVHYHTVLKNRVYKLVGIKLYKGTII